MSRANTAFLRPDPRATPLPPVSSAVPRCRIPSPTRTDGSQMVRRCFSRAPKRSDLISTCPSTIGALGSVAEQQSVLQQTFHASAERNLLACAAPADVTRHSQSHKTSGPRHALTSGRCCVHPGLCRNQLISGAQSEKQLRSSLTTVWTVCYPILVSVCEDAVNASTPAAATATCRPDTTA